MAQIGKPRRIVTDIPEPILVPAFKPVREPEKTPEEQEERELVPVRVQPRRV